MGSLALADSQILGVATARDGLAGNPAGDVHAELAELFAVTSESESHVSVACNTHVTICSERLICCE